MSKSFENAEEKRIYGLQSTEFLFLNDNNHLGVLDGGDSPGSQDQFLPRLLQVDDVDAVGLLLEDVLLHGGLTVVGADVGARRKHLRHVVLLEGQGRDPAGHPAAARCLKGGSRWDDGKTSRCESCYLLQLAFEAFLVGTKQRAENEGSNEKARTQHADACL